jgi:hypothetical protein
MEKILGADSREVKKYGSQQSPDFANNAKG